MVEEPPSVGEPATLPAEPGELGEADVGRIGRYMVIDTIGSGGMGDVLRAYDPMLGREVALKILRRRPIHNARAAEAEARLAMEAQAMARLSHPNVLPVFDVVRIGDALVIAMEYVPGPDLRHWLTTEERPWSEILEVLCQAGRGLLAAHRGGLVHRDFKPGNVLVGPGRHDQGWWARVTDFGLAKLMDGNTSSVEARRDTDTQDEEIGPLQRPLTRTGLVMGTPAYMAPEQHGGGGTTAAADQYGFCVTVYEALYGQRPFADDPTTLFAAKSLHELRPPPPKSPVPGAVYRALVRGMSPDPERRWPSMEALLDVLERRTTAKRSRGAAPVAGVVAVACVAVGVLYAQESEARSCRDSAELLTTQWAATRDSAAAAFAGTGLGFAGTTWDRVDGLVDDYVQRWSAMRAAACDAPDDDEQRDVRLHCLERASDHAVALFEVLAEADAGVIGNSVRAATLLPEPESCSDESVLQAEVEPPGAADAAAVAAVRRELAEVSALEDTGRFELGIARGQQALQEARALDYPPVHAEALLRLGRIERRAARHGEAEGHLTEAYFEASAIGYGSKAVAAAISLASTIGYDQARASEGRTWARHARAQLEHAPQLEESLLAAEGLVAMVDHRFDDALRSHQEALALAERNDGPDSLAAGQARNNLGNILVHTGRYEDAAAMFERVVEIYVALLGPQHPLVSSAFNNLGVAYKELERHEDAIAAYERAIEAGLQSLGPDHPEIGGIRGNLGVVYGELGRREDALREARRSLSNAEKALGPDHPDVAGQRMNVGVDLNALGRHDEALAMMRRGAAIFAAAGGSQHPQAVMADVSIGDVHYAMGELEVARQKYERALPLLRAQLGPDHPWVEQVKARLDAPDDRPLDPPSD